MAYTKKYWERRIAERADMCTGLVHLTCGSENENVFQVLLKILVDQKIMGSSFKKKTGKELRDEVRGIVTLRDLLY